MSTPHFIVRAALPADADQIAAAHVDSIHSLGAAVYGSDVISEWGAPRDGARYRKAMEAGELFFIAVANDPASDHVLGFSAYRVEDGKHRTAIYVRGDAARHRVGSSLFKIAEAAALQHGATEIHVDASLAAVNFYRSQGFQQLAIGQHRLQSGAVMGCVFMMKTLETG